VSLAFGLCFGAPVLSGEVFGAHIVPHSCHPKHRPSIVKDFWQGMTGDCAVTLPNLRNGTSP
jgi:hypothetical protein